MVRRVRAFAVVATLILLSWTAPAHAAWYKAETDRFIVYGAASEATVRDYAAKLQTFDSILRVFHPSTAARAPATKVQLYLVRGRDDLRRIQPALPPGIAGFYSAMNEGVFAVALTDGGLGKDDVLFHEYAHHFMLENFPAAYPAWFVEGFAEYFMTTDITWKGIKVGSFNQGRVNDVFIQTWVPLEDLLSKTVWEVPKNRREVFYAQSWLLMHYMRSDPVRGKRLDAAILATAEGEAPVKAFQTATGMDTAQLTAALRKYNKLSVLTFKEAMEAPPAMTVMRLPPSADDLLLHNLHLILASTGAPEPKLLADVRRDAAKYPGDRLAETTLARAEFVIGDVPAGEAIMKRRLTAEPEDPETLLLAGTGQVLAGMRDKASRAERYRASRPLLAKAYKLNERDFRPLYAYALSRSIEPVFPIENDLNALLEARGLAPAVQELSLRAGVALLARGRRAEAVRMLAPLVNNPHGGQAAATAKALIEGKSVAEADAAGATAEETPPPAGPGGPAPERTSAP
jgi:hypothetical protein